MNDEQIDAIWNALPGIRIHNEAHAKGIDTQVALRRAFARALLAASASAEPVGIAGSMPGTDGFTMAAFKAEDVPVGTELYTRPIEAPDHSRPVIADTAGAKAPTELRSAINEVADFLEGSANLSIISQFAAITESIDARKAAADAEFKTGICVALQAITARDDGVLWAEIVRACGVDDLLYHAAHIEPDEWELAGFAKYARDELGRDKPALLAAPRVASPAIDAAGASDVNLPREVKLHLKRVLLNNFNDETANALFERCISAPPASSVADTAGAEPDERDQFQAWLDKQWGNNDSITAYDAWMARAALAFPAIDTAGAKPVAWARADVPDRLGSRTAYSVTTELLKSPKDGYIPLYASPAIDAAPENAQAVALSERITQLQNALETALEFIADATITEGQWHWVEEARAALNAPASKEPK